MVEGRGLPGRRQVAIAALPGEVIGGLVLGVTTHTIGKSGMTERRRLPRRSRVAVAAQTRKVSGRLILGMAIRTGCKAGVIKGGGLPGLHGMARTAFARIVADGRIDLMAFLTRSRVLVIKTGGREGHIGVTVFARQPHLLKFTLVLIFVATDTGRREARGLPAHVTLIAVDLGMSAGKGRAMLGSQFRRQRD